MKKIVETCFGLGGRNELYCVHRTPDTLPFCIVASKCSVYLTPHEARALAEGILEILEDDNE